MVNQGVLFGIDPAAGHPERALALGYAPASAAAGIAALFALDATLARLALGTKDAMVAQLRLAWWREALSAIEERPAPAQPILQALSAAGARGDVLADMAAGWEHLLDPPSDEALRAFARARAALFTEAARLADARDETAVAGEGWALADLAGVTADAALARRARGLAEPLLAAAARQRWSPAGRFLGALVLVARADLGGVQAAGSPRRVVRLAWHRMTGR